MMYEVDFDAQVTNYAEEIIYKSEYVTRINLSRIVVLENSFGACVNKSMHDRLHFINKIQPKETETRHFDFRDPPKSSETTTPRPSRIITLRPRREGQLVGFTLFDIGYKPDLEWDLVVGEHNFPDIGYLWNSSRKQLIPMKAPTMHFCSSFREVEEVAQPTINNSSSDMLRRFL
jgi:hypothetical protein